MKVKANDFVEIDYLGKVKDTDIIFDLTNEKTAKEKGIHQKGGEYGPRTLCVGRSHILPALEEAMIGKEAGKEFSIDLNQDQAFGKKNPKLVRTIPTQELLKQKINPYPGLQIQIAGRVGVIRSVTRGRTMVDFNNQLAGRSVTYDIKILSIVEDEEKKIHGLLKTLIGLKDFTIEKANEEFKIKAKIPKPLQESFLKEVSETMPKTKVSFI